jgi:hypothetical protein
MGTGNNNNNNNNDNIYNNNNDITMTNFLTNRSIRSTYISRHRFAVETMQNTAKNCRILPIMVNTRTKL